MLLCVSSNEKHTLTTSHTLMCAYKLSFQSIILLSLDHERKRERGAGRLPENEESQRLILKVLHVKVHLVDLTREVFNR